MKTTTFVRVRFPRTADMELRQAMLISFDPLGLLEDEDGRERHYHEPRWSEIEQDVQQRFRESEAAFDAEVTRFEQENWNRQWEESIQPIAVSERFMIAPSWNQPERAEGKIVLTIDPKMSFGTGYHATTRLMLRLLERSVREGDSVLDMGSGTGVLAIAAVKLGAGSAFGVDTDEWSCANAEENAARNDVAAQLRFAQGSIELVDDAYDVILSNVTKIDNLQMLPRYGEVLKPGGRLMLSGFYHEDVSEVETALQSIGFQVTAERREDEWSAILATRED